MEVVGGVEILQIAMIEYYVGGLPYGVESANGGNRDS